MFENKVYLKADYTFIGKDNGSGTNGYCVVYQPQEFRIFGIVFGKRNDENTVECQSAYQ